MDFKQTALNSISDYKKNILIVVFTLLLIAPLVSHGEDKGEDKGEWLYTVQQDDNLWNLSEEYLSSSKEWSRLAEFNNVSDPQYLPPGTVLRFPVAWLKKSPSQALVISVYGDVMVRESPSVPFKALQEGMLLRPPAELKTGEQANAYLQFEDGSRLQLNANSILLLKLLNSYGNSGARDTQLDLRQGHLENQVAPKQHSGTRFEIITPSATTGVRGTGYRVAAEKSKQRTRVEVVEGNVAVASGGAEVAVPEGFATIAVAGQSPLIPRPLLAAPNLTSVPDSFDGKIEFSLPQQPGAVAARVQLRLSTNKNIQVFDQTFSTHVIKIPAVADGEYVVTVRSIDELGIEGQSASKTIVLVQDIWLARLLILGGAVLILLL